MTAIGLTLIAVACFGWLFHEAHKARLATERRRTAAWVLIASDWQRIARMAERRADVAEATVTALCRDRMAVKSERVDNVVPLRGVR